jgi:hypothetical protein
MSLSKSAEKRMLTAEEFDTVSRTHFPEIRELTRKQLSDLVRRLRDHRDKARPAAMKPTVFIHTNDKQILGALVSKHSFERFASNGPSTSSSSTPTTIRSLPLTRAALTCATG